MTPPAWHEEPIANSHDRKAFDGGNADLNLFLQRYARQSHDTGGAKTFLAIDDANCRTIHGFYSLAPAELSFEATPPLMRRGLVQHDVPGFRLARLAIDRRQQTGDWEGNCWRLRRDGACARRARSAASS